MSEFFDSLKIVNISALAELGKNANISVSLLSQPNNNHNPNNKTTITVVGLRLSNRWEYHPHHTNSKLHDRAKIEEN